MMRQGESGDSRETTGALLHLKDTSDYDIPDGEPDIRGWTVRGPDGREVGKVSDLLVDTGLGRIRYIEIELDGKVADDTGREWALVPVGAARLNEDEDDVVLEERAASFAKIPTYDRQRFSRDYERSLRTYYEGGSLSTSGDEDFYDHDAFDDSRFFGSRRRGRENQPYLRRAD